MTFKGHRSITKPDGSTDEGWETYTCGHCGTKVSGAVVAKYAWISEQKVRHTSHWVLCTNCAMGSVIVDRSIYPGALFGPSLQGLPNDVADAYQEARRCIEASSFTAAELVCRKVLMHIAVEKGAKEGDTFAAYLLHLEKEGYVTPPMKQWVEIIRVNGNGAAHKLPAVSRERAESTLMFTAELLRLTYEMEYLASKFGKKS